MRLQGQLPQQPVLWHYHHHNEHHDFDDEHYLDEHFDEHDLDYDDAFMPTGCLRLHRGHSVLQWYLQPGRRSLLPLPRNWRLVRRRRTVL
jgi:hypothetical protein